MLKKERIIISFVLLGISIMTTVDLVSDTLEGGSLWHIIFESLIALISLIGIFILLKGLINLKKDLETSQKYSQQLELDSLIWKKNSISYLKGLSIAIDEQLTQWNLTASEKDIAFLILKGLSSKEIAEIRKTSEKTVRTQSTSIYHKAGLTSRSQLSAFFLEDLLSPEQPGINNERI